MTERQVVKDELIELQSYFRNMEKMCEDRFHLEAYDAVGKAELNGQMWAYEDAANRLAEIVDRY